MSDLIKKLHDLAELIGNDVSVGIEYRQSKGLLPYILFTFDWPNHFHSRFKYSYLRVEMDLSDPELIIERIAVMAKEEYNKNN